MNAARKSLDRAIATTLSHPAPANDLRVGVGDGYGRIRQRPVDRPTGDPVPRRPSWSFLFPCQGR